MEMFAYHQVFTVYLFSFSFILSQLTFCFPENNNAIKDVRIFCFVGVNMLTSIGNKFEFMFYVTCCRI